MVRGSGVIKAKIVKQPGRVPLWLRRLGLVKAELKGVRFPRNAEEGLQQVAALSAASLRILKAEVRSGLPGADERQVQTAICRLLARLSHAEDRWIQHWKMERARCFGR